MKSLIFSLALMLIAGLSCGQTSVQLRLYHLLGMNGFSYERESANNLGSKFNVSRLQYYISKISIVHDDGKLTEASDMYVLVDASDSTIVDLGSFDISIVEAINFSIGVNTPENNQDPSKWPANHPLAPKNPSMYWDSTAGYRFVALEGKAGESHGTGFQVHALGNSNYHAISIPTSAIDINGTLLIQINADYNRAIEDIDVTNGPVIQGDHEEAAQLLRNFRDFVFTSLDGRGNILASAKDKSPTGFNAYPNPSNTGNITVKADDRSDLIDEYLIYDMNGQLIARELIHQTRKFELAIENPGLFVIELFSEGRLIGRNKISVIR